MILLHGGFDIKPIIFVLFLLCVVVIGFITFLVWLYKQAKSSNQPTILRQNYFFVFGLIFFIGIWLLLMLIV